MNSDDEEIHFRAFLSNLRIINQLNANPYNRLVFDINKFADFTEEEKRNMLIQAAGVKNEPR